MKKVLISLIFSIILVSCLYEKGGIIDPQTTGPSSENNGSGIGDGTNNGASVCNLLSGTGSVTTTNSDGQVCFDTQILPLIVSNCASSGCHNSKTKEDGYELVSYATIVKKGIVAGNPSKSKIYKVLTETGDDRMPPLPRSRLTTTQIKLISDWISQGAKNIVCSDNASAGGTLPDSVQISYTNHVKTIMDSYCVGCHKVGSVSGGVLLDSYTSVKTYADNGKLYGSIAQLSGFAAMPIGSKLSDCQIKVVKQWIDQGTKNN